MPGESLVPGHADLRNVEHLHRFTDVPRFEDMYRDADLRFAADVAGHADVSADGLRQPELRRTAMSADVGVRSELRRLAVPDIDWSPLVQRRQLPDHLRRCELRRRQLPDNGRRQLRICLSDGAWLANMRHGRLPTAHASRLAHLPSRHLRHIVCGAELSG